MYRAIQYTIVEGHICTSERSASQHPTVPLKTGASQLAALCKATVRGRAQTHLSGGGARGPGAVYGAELGLLLPNILCCCGTWRPWCKMTSSGYIVTPYHLESDDYDYDYDYDYDFVLNC